MGDNWNTATSGAVWTSPGSKVGIGAAPTWPMHVVGGVGVYGPGGDFTALQLRAGSGNGDITRLTFAGDGDGQYAQVIGQVLSEADNGNLASSGKLIFRTRSGGTGLLGDMADRMVVDPYGNVGIGTPSPNARLEVVAPNGDGIRIKASGGESSANLFLEPSSANSNNRKWVISSYFDAHGDFAIRNSNTPTDHPYGASGTTRLHINKDGNVAIGKTSAIARLEVFHSNPNEFSLIASSNQRYKQFQVRAGRSDDEAGEPLIKFNGYYGTRIGRPEDGGEFYQDRFGKLMINVNGATNVMTIAPTGEVGIGTMTPSANKKLDVRGNASISGELAVGSIVTRTWTVAPDYVFEKEYRLAGLDEVDAFVRKHKHLPEVPSAREFKEKGMDLAEMNFLLLKKVEELTLHAIQQQKENLAQSRKIERLENRLLKQTKD